MPEVHREHGWYRVIAQNNRERLVVVGDIFFSLSQSQESPCIAINSLPLFRRFELKSNALYWESGCIEQFIPLGTLGKPTL